MVRENNLPGTTEQMLVAYDNAGANRKVIVSTSQFATPEDNGPFRINSFTLSQDGKRILISAEGTDGRENQPVYWLLARESGKLQKVKAGRNSIISPDGQNILFSDNGNLFVYSLQNNFTTELTSDGDPGSLTYGQAAWSPDGKRIVFVQSDVSRVRLRSMLVPSDPSYPGVRELRFARVGGTIAGLKVGIVDINGKKTIWLPVPIPSEGYYLGQVSWAGNSSEVLVEKLSRFRDKREILLASVDNGCMKTIFKETDPAWVVASYGTNLGLEWFNDYDNFLIISEKNGWRHAYTCSRDGMKQIDITPGEFDIIERVAVDKSEGWFYFSASPKNGTQSYLFRARLNGKGKPQRLTPVDQPGYHLYDISPDSQYAFHTFSSANIPPVTEIVKLPDHKVVRVLEDNKDLLKKTSLLPQKEFFQVDIGKGVVIDGWMIKPGDFDPSRKYPVFVYVYGEPHAQTVRDSWGHASADYHRVIADLGYLVVSMDNRGTPCPKGAAWRRAIAGRLGPLSTEEQAAALKELGRTRSYVDLSRVGIWGWSGGGSNTLNALFRKPNIYQLGIAVVPKPRPELYNAWFQEIYMNTPEVNPEGYRVSAPINYAEGLEGNLLILTGTGETNTHVQIVESLVDRLIELGKQFDYFSYPNRSHGLRVGKGTQLHVRVYMARYLLSHLQPGPVDIE
ncbi:MAG: DPP IV N-terminal domain-containing protein [Deltaproteobacteria bacterium]|nr:DPP IV N-terminal domain-containing protein [Deltaproteobacteria bacterium]